VVGQWQIAGVVGASDINPEIPPFLSEQAEKSLQRLWIKRQQLSI
jgi:hypothetical protein